MSAKLDILSDDLPEAAQTFLVTHIPRDALSSA